MTLWPLTSWPLTSYFLPMISNIWHINANIWPDLWYITYDLLTSDMGPPDLCSLTYKILPLTYNIWPMPYSILPLTYNIWTSDLQHMTSWLTVYDLWPTVWPLTYNIWPPDLQHMTPWPTTYDPLTYSIWPLTYNIWPPDLGPTDLC